MKTILSRLSIIFFLLPFCGTAQKGDTLLNTRTLSAIKFRSIGPAFMSGRIADIATHPKNQNCWYVAVGSGGVWKTVNAGTTWTPIFDQQGSYSIGCVTIDPTNYNTVWVGTGENVGGRHVGYGDGVYRSNDGGQTWSNMGLKGSQHISKIIVHPTDPNTIWVASQGPLWTSGGQRGVYKSIDAGKSWKLVLGDTLWTGANDILIDPRNPMRLYAATWQRHRNVALYLGGGPGTAIYRSEDGGETWEKLSKGLPAGPMGKIGLAVSPQQPDIIYAAIELERRSGGVYRSSDRGASWTKMSNAVAGATGPHYYQELYASPHTFDRIYLVDYHMQISNDGGKTFTRMNEHNKHSDNHAIAFRPDDPNYLLIGTDGGLYESFDLGVSWKFVSNLPLTQYYKVAVDDAWPIYNIYGGTQDNNTQGGPSRTFFPHGIGNEDWRIILFADGHQPATEPGNPDIVYAEWQEGNLVRIDRKTGELVPIQPQPAKGDPAERFNWDSPILVSPHNPKRIYFASQRVWRSDDRGDKWTAISGDLTRNQDRMTLQVMGKTWSWDSPWDLYAMSNFNSITSLAESPKLEGLLYAGSDDGLLHVSEDGGRNWRRMEVGNISGVPLGAFINDIKADLFDANTVYMVLDNHKHGDLNPYIYKSNDRGKTWKSIKGNLPERNILWRIVQDHINPELLFLGTEYGVYFSQNGGGKWIKLSGGMPVISVRDLAIQRRENDLVAATFGRSFYILDDYSFLRSISENMLRNEAALFPVKDAWWFIPEPRYDFGRDKGSQGDAYFAADNPPYGAVFTYYIKESYLSKKELRQKQESLLIKENKEVTFPGWESLEKEIEQEKPGLWLQIKDSLGNSIRWIKAANSAGLQRSSWDLKSGSGSPLTHPSSDEGNGLIVMPGSYSVSLIKEIDGEFILIAGPEPFNVIKVRESALPGIKPELISAFKTEFCALQADISLFNIYLGKAKTRMELMQKAYRLAKIQDPKLDSSLTVLREELISLENRVNGSRAKSEIGEKAPMTMNERLGFIGLGLNNSSYGPTATMQMNLDIAREQYLDFNKQLEIIMKEKMPLLEKALMDAGAPVIVGP
jgi:photosystem II stability/assembly factor-like uncharacterized protein